MNEFLAMTVPDGVIWAALVGIVSSIWGLLKVAGMYWAKRENGRTTRYKEVIDGKDELLRETIEAKDGVIEAKDEEIKELGKELSRKSAAHAQKVEQLMNLTLVKVEELGEKHLAWGDKAFVVMTKFSTAVDKLNLEEGV